MTYKVGIIGMGGIGKHLAYRVAALGWDVQTIGRPPKDLSVSQWLERKDWGQDRDLIFLCISTQDNGENASRYIRYFAGQGIPVVTCEKGALAYHIEYLEPYVSKIGCSAAVGGGTQMLSYLQGRQAAVTKRMSIDAVINGTLNYIFHQVAEGSTLGGACADAVRLGYTEPGASDPVSLINGEMRDVILKTCTLFNISLTKGSYLTPENFVFLPLKENEIEILASEAASRRMMVSISNRTHPSTEEFFMGGVGLRYVEDIEDWKIRFGFRSIQHHADFDWLPGGVGNALCITEGSLGSGGRYVLSGPGAGHEPTTTAMINDAIRLLESRPHNS